MKVPRRHMTHHDTSCIYGYRAKCRFGRPKIKDQFRLVICFDSYQTLNMKMVLGSVLFSVLAGWPCLVCTVR